MPDIDIDDMFLKLRSTNPQAKMDLALRLAQESLNDQAKDSTDLGARFDALRLHAASLEAGISAIVAITMMEDLDDRSPEEVTKAVISRLTSPN